MRVLAWIVGTLMAVAATATASEPALPTGEQALLQTDAGFAEAVAQRGLEGWLAYFDTDASIFPGDHPIVTGLEAIERYYADTHFDPSGLTWTPVGARMAASGDLGYTYGTWELHRTSAGVAVLIAHGQYLTVWKRQPDGGWKVVADIGSTAPPETAPAP
jgi:ketosteroid isomerase-like protein